MKTNTILVLIALLLGGIIVFQLAQRQLLRQKAGATCVGKTCMKQPSGTCAPGQKCTQ